MEEYVCIVERPVSADSPEEAAEKFLRRLEDGDLGVVEVFDETPIDSMDTDRRVKVTLF